MAPSDKTRFKDLMADVMSLYRQGVTPFTLQVWWAACAPFEYEQVAQALTAHVMSPEDCKFPPLPGDVVRVLRGTLVDRSALAWGKVMDAAARVGAYGSVAFDDPAIHAAIEDLGGWPKLCATEGKDLGFAQHRFCEAHKAYSRRERFDYPGHLPGLHEGSNALRSLAQGPSTGSGPQLALVGDPLRAGEVRRLGGAGTAKTLITPIHLDTALSTIPGGLSRSIPPALPPRPAGKALPRSATP